MSARKFLSAAAALTLGLATASAFADTWKIDPVHSSAIFKIKHLNTANFYGRFDGPSGTITTDPNDPSKTKVEATIKVDTVSTANAKRDEHVRSPDFFAVKQFPTATFKSTSVTKVDEKTLDVAGNLTLHGTEKPVTVKLVNTGEGKGMNGKPIIGYEGKFTVKMSDFDIKGMPNALSDEVEVTIAIEAGKQD